MPVTWQQLYADRTAGMRASDIREILKVTERPDIISLAGGLPAPELFPIDEYRRAFEWVLEADGAQALHLIGKIFINPGDAVLVEKPTYLGALQAFNQYQATYAVVPMDEDGMRVDDVERILTRQRIKFIYALPN